MTTLGPAIAWYDPASGKTYPLDYYKPETANYLDAHKAGWRLAYAPVVEAVATIQITREDRLLADGISQVRKTLPLARQS